MNMENKNEFETQESILFCIYRGIKNTKKSFETIKKVRPYKLYIASDGNTNKLIEKEINYIRNWVLKSINWDCEINTLFRNNNLGVKVAMKEAIDWVADKEDYFFVIECDCFVHNQFIKLAPLLKNDLELSGLKKFNICSYSLNINKNEDLIFKRATLCMIWGWYVSTNTWKSFKIDCYPKFTSLLLLKFLISNNLGFKSTIFWLAKLFDCYAELDRTWGNRYAIHCMIKNIPSFIPNKILCNNIGIGDECATHANSLYLCLSNNNFDPNEKFKYNNLLDNKLNISNDKIFGRELFKIYSDPYKIRIKAILVILFGSNSKKIYNYYKLLFNLINYK